MSGSRGFVVEFIGAPGVGKSTLSEALAAELRGLGEIALEPTRRLARAPGARQRVLAKLGFALRALARHPVSVARMVAAIQRSRQPSLGDFVHVAFNLVFVCGLVGSLRDRPGIHLLDQGVFQAIWSVALTATADDEKTRIAEAMAVLARACTGRSAADCVFALHATRGSVAERLTKRPGSQSRLESELGRDGFDAAFDESLRVQRDIECLARSAGCDVLDVDAEIAFDSTAFRAVLDQAAANLVAVRNAHTTTKSGQPSAKQRIAIVTNTGWNMIRFRSALLLRLLDEGWQVTAIGDFREEEIAELRALGVDVAVARLEASGTNPIRDLRYAWRMYSLYRELRPDVVHHFSIKPVVYGSLAAKLAGVHRVVCSITGLGIGYAAKRTWLRAIVGLLYRAALFGDTRVVFQNQENMQRLIADGFVDAERAVLSPGSGVDTRALVPLEGIALGERNTFIMVSRMLWSKGVGDFVTAARLVAARHPAARFVLFGGSQADYSSKNPDFVPQEWLEALGPEGVVEWRGFTKPAEVERAMQRCAALVHPSSYPEGIPRTLIEASAAGVPIITTDTPGCRDAVQDDVSGFLVPTHAPEALADAMSALLEDPERIRSMGAAGRRRAVERFDERVVLEDLLRVYTAA